MDTPQGQRPDLACCDWYVASLGEGPAWDSPKGDVRNGDVFLGCRTDVRVHDIPRGIEGRSEELVCSDSPPTPLEGTCLWRSWSSVHADRTWLVSIRSLDCPTDVGWLGGDGGHRGGSPVDLGSVWGSSMALAGGHRLRWPGCGGWRAACRTSLVRRQGRWVPLLAACCLRLCRRSLRLCGGRIALDGQDRWTVSGPAPHVAVLGARGVSFPDASRALVGAVMDAGTGVAVLHHPVAPVLLLRVLLALI
jgi:hypothetical protein